MLSKLTSLFSFNASDPTSAARRKAFSDIFYAKRWGEGESISGPGSGVARASLFRSDFELLLRELRVRNLLDAGCGDFNWLPSFDLRGIRVIAIDIVPELVSANRKRHPGVHFRVADIVVDALPKADLILSRDALVHLSNDDILRAFANFRRSGAKWLLTNTFIGHDRNGDIPTGSWRPLNLNRPPFSLPEPSRIIDECCFGYDGVYRDKRLALWRCIDLPAG
ncbi:MAG TPA: class I SAM-dependent methyltransferase [Xanthobacteraceae bacterium]|nr:class I SAM-dependent methyltransferase [Xanthobacteraceae bacterium]